MGGQGSGRKPGIGKIFDTHQTEQAGMESFDNIRENIDPHIKTQVVSTKEISFTNYSGAGYVKNLAGGELEGGHAGGDVVESDPIWISQSGAYLKTADEADPIWLSQSGAYLKTADLAGAETDPVWISQSGAYVKDAPFQTLSGAYTTHAASGSIHFTSGAFTTHAASGSIHFTSGAFTTHLADSSDPHGATLTQTTLNVTTGATTADSDASGAAIFRNVLIGTEASPYAASNCVQGTIYMQYTA